MFSYYTIIVTFVKNYWKPLLGAAMGIFLAAYVQILRWENTRDQKKLVDLDQQVQVLKDSNKALTDSIAIANTALQKSQAAATKAQTDMDALKVQIAKQTIVRDQRLAAIKANKEPVTCPDTIKYMLDYAKGNSK